MIGSLSLNAQSFIAPVIPESILPTAADVAMQSKIYNTSSYSYEDVNFNIGTDDGGDFYAAQDLYVYAWSSDNADGMTGNGITFRRKDPFSGITTDEGFIQVPRNKKYLEVGLLQADDNKVYVIMLWNGIKNITFQKGTFYDLFEWNASGLTPTADSNIAINSYFFSAANVSVGYRVSMDCRNLKEAVFCWEEKWKSATNPGGIFLKTLKVSGPPPFLTAKNIKISGVTDEYHYPDVAYAMNDSLVRVAFKKVNADPSIATIMVVNTPYNTLTSLPYTPTPDVISPPIPVAFLTDFVGVDYVHYDIYAYSPDQISLDALEGFPEIDLWSVVYKADEANIKSITKGTDGLIHEKTLSYALEELNNNNPVVAYQTLATGGIKSIAFVWYCAGMKKYVSTQLDLDGSAFISPTVPGTYFFVNQGIFALPNYDMAIPTMSRNHLIRRGILTAYPISTGVGVPFDMRAKLVPNAPILSFKANGNLPFQEQQISLYPNPCTEFIQLEISNYNNNKISIKVTDLQGKTLLNLENQTLANVNSKLNQLLSKLQTGLYNLAIISDDQLKILKFTKL